MKTILEKFEKITIECSLDEYKEQVFKLREGGWTIKRSEVKTGNICKLIGTRLI